MLFAHPVWDDAPLSPAPQIGPSEGQLQHTSVVRDTGLASAQAGRHG